ncbi:uncharacterized protein LOC106671927 [Cimex lectularius]|uniref:Uncharacterized protein n=1 Tax=Cimex lectularius TaxID=79782 RepID=A0A8I6S6I3_CIMLE|nr:uncharacterized protein LOC106671927 [Cimex lectularius]
MGSTASKRPSNTIVNEMYCQTLDPILAFTPMKNKKDLYYEIRCDCDNKLYDGVVLADEREMPKSDALTDSDKEVQTVEGRCEEGVPGCSGQVVQAKKCRRRGSFENGKDTTLESRNWRRMSTHPFINFLRTFRRNSPPKMNIHMIARQGRIVWRQMSPLCKLPFIEQARRARCRGYIN